MRRQIVNARAEEITLLVGPEHLDAAHPELARFNFDHVRRRAGRPLWKEEEQQ
jgi:hypothetical protein